MDHGDSETAAPCSPTATLSSPDNGTNFWQTVSNSSRLAKTPPSSFGSSESEALANLKEALELFFEDLPESVTMPKISNVTVGELAIA
ncbi:MAG: type II toxin-antitoxin system HicB family antitoxin [Luteolibacter sp.]|uniref:type II toxin-antitoxin system HicB family antitoxin n=1 Tax=Luteolibacter sp. TaxID=1962973 RepID=UPI0032633DA0